jgi:hypothetical protein
MPIYRRVTSGPDGRRGAIAQRVRACLRLPEYVNTVVEVANEMDHLGCSGGRSMWQIIGYWLGWSGSPGKGRAVGENRFSGDIKPDIKRVR